MNIWEKIYQKDYLNFVKISSLHPLFQLPEGTQDTYLYNSRYYISVSDSFWHIWTNPEYVPLSAFDINKFYSLRYYLCDKHSSATYPDTYQISIQVDNLSGDLKEIASHILANLYHPHPDNHYWRKFITLRDYTNFVFGGEILSHRSGTTPYYINRDTGQVGLASVYGPILFGDKEHISPIYVSKVPYLSFPHARDIFRDDEIAALEHTSDVWVDKHGVYVYVPQGDSALSIARAAHKVTSLRYLYREQRHTTVPYEDKVGTPYQADVAKEMRSVYLQHRMIQPQRYIQPYSSGMDYTSAIATTKGVFRQ